MMNKRRMFDFITILTIERRCIVIAIYLITCELHHNKNSDLINQRINKLGDCIRPLGPFWLIDTALSYTELYNYVVATVDKNDMFYITSINSPGMGRLDMEDTNWIKKKFLMPVTPNAPSGSPKGPLPVQEQPPVHTPLPVRNKQPFPKLHWNSD